MYRSGLVLLDFIFGCRISSGHPSHCRPSLVLLNLFLLLSPLQVITHLSSDLSWCFWTSCSAIPFPAVTHPTTDRARCCLTFFFECLLFRWSPIQVPTWHGSPGLRLRLSRFPAVTHSTADRARCCFTVFLDCLLFRRSSIQVPTRYGAGGLHLRLSRFRRSPIPLLTGPGAA